MENKTVEITVRQSSKVVLIAKVFERSFLSGFIFRDELQGQDICFKI